MTAPDLTRTGCRVLDKDGDDWTALAFLDTGYAEWKALHIAIRNAEFYPDYAPYTVVDADGVTLHTINAPEAK